jgi:hypothetical protein
MATSVYFLDSKLWMTRWALDLSSVAALVSLLHPGEEGEELERLANKYYRYFKGGTTDDTVVMSAVAQLLQIDPTVPVLFLMRCSVLEFFDRIPSNYRTTMLLSAPPEAIESRLGLSIDDLKSRSALRAGSVTEHANVAKDEYSISLVDTMDELEDLLVTALQSARRSLKAFRIASPYATMRPAQRKFRAQVAQRILAGTIEVQRAEILYTRERLTEVLSNAIRYQGKSYWIKSYCGGRLSPEDAVPGMGGYMFDDSEIFLGAYWQTLPPHDKHGLRLTGSAARRYFNEYWNYIWDRGTLLHPAARPDQYSRFKEAATQLGVAEKDWPQVLEQAKFLASDSEDPPLI